MSAENQIRDCAVLIVDIAGSVRLRERIGEAAAERRIRHLLDEIIAASGARGGEFIKSYGDDVMAIFEHDAINAAASTAIAAQNLALESGLELYAGLHAGPVEFRTTMGHPDAVGQTVSLAARLHKLTEGAPGRIFMTERWVSSLSLEIRQRAQLFGPRELKGLGAVNIWTLDWNDSHEDSTGTCMSPLATMAQEFIPMRLRLGAAVLQLTERKTYLLGRGKECALRVFDPEARISTTHLQLEYGAGFWFAQDISRNGTWMRDQKSGEIQLLPYCNKALLPKRGDFCLGRNYTEDPNGLFTVHFEPLDDST